MVHRALRFKVVIIALFCVSAALPPIPGVKTKPLLSPKAAANVSTPMLIIVPPAVTNYSIIMSWPVIPNAQNYTAFIYTNRPIGTLGWQFAAVTTNTSVTQVIKILDTIWPVYGRILVVRSNGSNSWSELVNIDGWSANAIRISPSNSVPGLVVIETSPNLRTWTVTSFKLPHTNMLNGDNLYFRAMTQTNQLILLIEEQWLWDKSLGILGR